MIVNISYTRQFPETGDMSRRLKMWAKRRRIMREEAIEGKDDVKINVIGEEV